MNMYDMQQDDTEDTDDVGQPLDQADQILDFISKYNPDSSLARGPASIAEPVPTNINDTFVVPQPNATKQFNTLVPDISSQVQPKTQRDISPSITPRVPITKEEFINQNKTRTEKTGGLTPETLQEMVRRFRGEQDIASNSRSNIDLLAGLSRAGSQIGAAIARTHPDYTGAEYLDQQAKVVPSEVGKNQEEELAITKMAQHEKEIKEQAALRRLQQESLRNQKEDILSTKRLDQLNKLLTEEVASGRRHLVLQLEINNLLIMLWHCLKGLKI